MQKKFSYPLVVAELPQAEQRSGCRRASDCGYLAEILKVPVMRFEADLRLKNDHTSGNAGCQRRISACLKLGSVVSLGCLIRIMIFGFRSLFDTAAAYDDGQREEGDWAADLPDLVIGGQIDLGGIAIEQVAVWMIIASARRGYFILNPSSRRSKNADNPFEFWQN